MRSTNSVVVVEVEDRVATITLNRPEARNALNEELRQGLWGAVDSVGSDPAVDAVVLTGAEPAFCAGIDLKEVLAGSEEPSDAFSTSYHREDNGLFRYFPLIRQPIIGAVNGVAVTGGLEVALQCTFLIASERARFADTHARVGIMPGGGVTVLLGRSIGFRRAIEMSLTGNFVTAQEAFAWGLVNHVVPHEELLSTARQLARDIAGNDQVGVGRLLRHYRQAENAATLDEALLLEGYMAETWERPSGDAVLRRRGVMDRGRQQLQ